ncbi:MAG: stage V sporulation protein AB [Lachnospiraceae bacterium]|nr:stage V sporulation protein AB [Lachnospiraceae bacterium]
MFFIGLCSGGVIAAGLFSFIVSIGALTRIIGKMHLGNRVRLFEYFAAAGITLGNLGSIYTPGLMKWLPLWFSVVFMALFGLFAGIFVGVLVMSLAESLNALPVFARNTHMLEGMKYVIASIAAGKGIGAWLDFWMNMR